jgi:hypothetical protein
MGPFLSFCLTACLSRFPAEVVVLPYVGGLTDYNDTDEEILMKYGMEIIPLGSSQ